MLPDFKKINGLLPEGEHEASWAEVSQRFGNSAGRNALLAGLLEACRSLSNAGVKYLYLDGSFVTAKRNPGDWDACYSQVGVIAALLDPVLLDFTNGRAAQKNKFKGEAFVAEASAAGLLGPPYLKFFQTEKGTGKAKGIVKLDLGTLP
ncbi:hypothetical protein [Duganella sp. Leaf61]|uniref:DUF6932 family protein n=1 Tax=Duganella sp. Leaf61 TaxID=1736227 RepID=UPI0012E30861|nr:hypothetical protein [Duganella sp. Leaf61]